MGRFRFWGAVQSEKARERTWETVDNFQEDRHGPVREVGNSDARRLRAVPEQGTTRQILQGGRTMTEEQHKWLLLTVRDLDAVIPNPAGAVQVVSDEDSQTFMATQDGYLRLGVEMLKAATVTSGEKQGDDVLRLDFDLSRLLAADNELEVDAFLLVDAIEPGPRPDPEFVPRSNPWTERFMMLCMIVFVCFLVLALGVGITTIVSYLLGLLH